jgi:hypothetical protein
LYRHLDFYRNLKSIDEVLKYAPSGEDYVPDKKHKHQWRISINAVESTKHNLLNLKAQILSCKKFEEIKKLVKQGSASGFGKLARYDTALRIGAFMNNILPEVIYLHCGTKDGARNMGLGYNKEFLTKDELPELLRELEPYEVEAFLCVKKDKLNWYLK